MATTGFLQVKVSGGEEAFPIEGAIVLISPNDGEENGVIYSLRTDNSGLTDKIGLDTKSAALSERPEEETPYLTYNAEIKKEGYYVSNIMNIPIFEGITATLPVNLVPLGLGESNYDLSAEENREYTYLPDNERLKGDRNE